MFSLDKAMNIEAFQLISTMNIKCISIVSTDSYEIKIVNPNDKLIS